MNIPSDKIELEVPQVFIQLILFENYTVGRIGMNKKLKTGTFRRILWFGIVNVTIIATLIAVTNGAFLSFAPFLLIYACLMPFVNLMFCKRVLKKAYRLTMIEEGYEYDEKIEWYRETVHTICKQAKMKKMPEIAIYDAEDRNAFATGRSKKSSLIAVSTGLLYGMSADGVEAVIAHEVSHIVNGDMVTQTLLQSALTMVVSVILLPITLTRWILFFMIDDDNILFFLITLLIEFLISTLLFFISGLLVKRYSRKREFKADYLASQLTQPEKMIQALQELEGPAILPRSQKKYAALQFNGSGRFLDIFSTHPSTKRRIKYLEKKFRQSANKS